MSKARIDEFGERQVDISQHLRWERDTGEFRTQIAQPIDPYLNAAKLRREFEEWNGIRKNAEIMRVASLPIVIVMKIKKDHGVDAMNLKGEEQQKKLLRIIQSEYPHLMTTNKKIHVRKGSK